MSTEPHCYCLSGLSEGEAALLELGGVLRMADGMALRAVVEHCGFEPTANREVVTFVEKLRTELQRGAEFCRTHCWKGGAR